MLDNEDPRTVEGILLAAGVSSGDLEAIRRMRPPEAERCLEAFKARFKMGFRSLSKQWHPDITGGDAQKAEMLRVLVLLQKAIQALVLPRVPVAPSQAPVRRGVVVHYYPDQGGVVRTRVDSYSSAMAFSTMGRGFRR